MQQTGQNELTQKVVRIGNYQVSSTIGVGTFSKVRIGKHVQTGEPVAIKIIQKKNIKDQGDRNRLNLEMRILRKIRHPNIMQLYEIIETGKHLFLITELIANGQLFDYIVQHRRLEQQVASKFLQQLLNGIQYLHQLGVVHRDLKPENLLLDEKSNIKIVDFGLSNIYGQGELLHTACGSPCYAAPQMIAGHPYVGLKTDIWSCGIILYAMICGYLPFESTENNTVMYKKIMSGQYTIPSFVSPVARDLLNRIMNINPDTRYTISEIRSHPFCNPPQPIILGLIPKQSRLRLQISIVERLKNSSQEGIQKLEQMLHQNKHNPCTATYYLELNKKLKRENRTLLDYYAENQCFIRNDARFFRRLGADKEVRKTDGEQFIAIRKSLQYKRPNTQSQRGKERLSEKHDRKTRAISRPKHELPSTTLAQPHMIQRPTKRGMLLGSNINSIKSKRSESEKLNKIQRVYGSGLRKRQFIPTKNSSTRASSSSRQRRIIR